MGRSRLWNGLVTCTSAAYRLTGGRIGSTRAVASRSCCSTTSGGSSGKKRTNRCSTCASTATTCAIVASTWPAHTSIRRRGSDLRSTASARRRCRSTASGRRGPAHDERGAAGIARAVVGPRYRGAGPTTRPLSRSATERGIPVDRSPSGDGDVTPSRVATETPAGRGYPFRDGHGYSRRSVSDVRASPRSEASHELASADHATQGRGAERDSPSCWASAPTRSSRRTRPISPTSAPPASTPRCATG